MLQLTNPQETFKFVGFLSEALPYIDEWTPTDINSGGCGMFAQLLSEKLTSLNISHQIFALYFDKRSKSAESSLKNFIQEGKDLKTAGADHVCIKVSDIYVDSTGVINHAVMHTIDKVELTKTQLDQIVDGGEWSPMFDRGCREFINNKLDEVFADYEHFYTGEFPLPKDGQIHYTPYTVKMKKKFGMPSMNNLLSFHM